MKAGRFILSYFYFYYNFSRVYTLTLFKYLLHNFGGENSLINDESSNPYDSRLFLPFLVITYTLSLFNNGI